MPQEASSLDVPIKSRPASYLSANGCLARGVKADGRGTPPTWILAGIPQVQTCCRSRHTGPKESHIRQSVSVGILGQQGNKALEWRHNSFYCQRSQIGPYTLARMDQRGYHHMYTPRLRTTSRSVQRTSNAHGSLVDCVLSPTILFKDPFRTHRLTIECPFQTLVHVRSILIQTTVFNVSRPSAWTPVPRLILLARCLWTSL